MGKSRKNKQVEELAMNETNEMALGETDLVGQMEFTPAPEEPKEAEAEKAEAVAEAKQPQQTVLYQNAADQMMTVIHLYSQRTPVTYGNGKKKVFNRFGEKFSISVREFEQDFATSPVGEALLRQKILAVGEDCPKEIRERLEIDYNMRELITPERYKELLTLDTNNVVALFKTLCFEHKQLMVKIFADDFESENGLHCQREKIKALNDASKAFVKSGERGLFAALLEQITDQEVY